MLISSFSIKKIKSRSSIVQRTVFINAWNSRQSMSFSFAIITIIIIIDDDDDDEEEDDD